MTYTPTTLDDLNKQKAKSLQPTKGEVAGHFAGLILVALFAVVALLSGSPFLWISYIIMAVAYFIYSEKTKNVNDPAKKMDDAFEQYYYYALQREIDYYSVKPLHQRSACGDVFRVCVTPASHHSADVDTFLWEGVYPGGGTMKPSDYVVALPNRCYDYTLYLTEVAYRFMIACHRLKLGEPKICNFAESVAYQCFGVGTRCGTREFNMATRPYIPFNEYPIDEVQQYELCHFDYRSTHVRSGWIWQAWLAAEQRFKADLAKHPTIVPYDSLTAKEYDHMSKLQESWESGKNDAHFIVQRRLMRENFDSCWH